MELAIAPAGLATTGYCDDRALWSRRAAGYELQEGKLRNAAPLRMTIRFSAGALCSTALEVARFAVALEQGKVVSKQSYTSMTTPGKTADGKETGYGFGLGISDFEGHRRIGHGGGIPGFVSQQGRYPADDLTVVVLVNTASGAADLLEQRVARAALGLPEPVLKDLPVEEADQQAIAGVYLFQGKHRYEIRFEKGKALGRNLPGGTDDLLFHQGDLIFAEKDSANRLRFNRVGGKIKSLTIGDGKRWGPEAPRE